MSSHGSCNGCGKSFGVFKKEKACGNCGLLFCSKCVANKAAVPTLSGAIHQVCIRCFKVLTGKIKDTTAQKRDISPPANFLRNLQAAQVKNAAHEHHSSRKKSLTSDPVVKKHLKPEYRNMSIEDMEIAERFEKLKEASKEVLLGPNPLPPVQDVEQRLARLKGIPEKTTPAPSASSIPSNIPHSKPLTQQEETNLLLKQVGEEVNIDRKVAGDGEHAAESSKPTQVSQSKGEEDLADVHSLIAQAAAELEIDAQKAIAELKQDKEIMARLRQLKSKKATDEDGKCTPSAGETNAGESSDEEECEEDEVKTVLQQMLEEKKLDEKVEAECGGHKPPLRKERSIHLTLDEPEPDLDELPWCCICNEDATIRCLDCDMDLYCKRCFKEGHQLYEDDHEYIPYKNKVKPDI